MKANDFIVLISSCDRYKYLTELLKQIPKGIEIIVCNDGSTDKRYNKLIGKENVTYLENYENNGKKFYWATVNKLFAEARKNRKWKYLVYLDDDFILCEDFFSKLSKIVKQHNKNSFDTAAVNVRNDGLNRAWKGLDIWVDGGACYYRQWLEKIDFKLNPISINHWKKNPLLGSLVWRQMTHRIDDEKLNIIMCEKSMVYHRNIDSVMNPEARKMTPLKTKNFDNALRIAVIFCTWQRKENFVNTLECLLKQDYKNFDVYIWNNNYSEREFFNNALNDYRDLLNVKIYHSKSNVGGIGRFYQAQKIADNYDKFIFIDDDQVFNDSLISDFINLHSEKSIFSWFSFKTTDFSYYKGRQRVISGPADYCATCGMIIDSDIFTDPKLFDFPKEYYFIEDLWLSYFAKYEHHYSLNGCSVGIEVKEDGKGQWVALKPLKEEFYQWLQKKYLGHKTQIGYKNKSFILHHHNDHIGNVIERTKTFYESKMLSYIENIFQGGNIVDVGANIGNHTVFFSKVCKSGEVISIEPIPENYKLLEKNIASNNIKNCTPFNIALSDNNFKYSCKKVPENMGMSTIFPDSNGEHTTARPVHLIKKRFSLLKIDCENMSLTILKAFLPLIAKFRPDVFIELDEKELKAARMLGFEVIAQFNATPTFHLRFN